MLRDIIHPETWSVVTSWAKAQKCVTNKAICEHFGLNESRADLIYEALKEAKVIGCTGYTLSGMTR